MKKLILCWMGLLCYFKLPKISQNCWQGTKYKKEEIIPLKKRKLLIQKFKLKIWSNQLSKFVVPLAICHFIPRTLFSHPNFTCSFLLVVAPQKIYFIRKSGLKTYVSTNIIQLCLYRVNPKNENKHKSVRNIKILLQFQSIKKI